jgi:hypothetical protein
MVTSDSDAQAPMVTLGDSTPSSFNPTLASESTLYTDWAGVKRSR